VNATRGEHKKGVETMKKLLLLISCLAFGVLMLGPSALAAPTAPLAELNGTIARNWASAPDIYNLPDPTVNGLSAAGGLFYHPQGLNGTGGDEVIRAMAQGVFSTLGTGYNTVPFGPTSSANLALLPETVTFAGVFEYNLTSGLSFIGLRDSYLNTPLTYSFNTAFVADSNNNYVEGGPSGGEGVTPGFFSTSLTTTLANLYSG